MLLENFPVHEFSRKNVPIICRACDRPIIKKVLQIEFGQILKRTLKEHYNEMEKNRSINVTPIVHGVSFPYIRSMCKYKRHENSPVSFRDYRLL